MRPVEKTAPSLVRKRVVLRLAATALQFDRRVPAAASVTTYVGRDTKRVDRGTAAPSCGV